MRLHYVLLGVLLLVVAYIILSQRPATDVSPPEGMEEEIMDFIPCVEFIPFYEVVDERNGLLILRGDVNKISEINEHIFASADICGGKVMYINIDGNHQFTIKVEDNLIFIFFDANGNGYVGLTSVSGVIPPGGTEVYAFYEELTPIVEEYMEGVLVEFKEEPPYLRYVLLIPSEEGDVDGFINALKREGWSVLPSYSSGEKTFVLSKGERRMMIIVGDVELEVLGRVG